MIEPETKLAATAMRTGMLLALVMAFTAAAFPTTLDQYKPKVDSARALALQIEGSLRSGKPTGAQIRAFAAQTRKDFPASERIEWEGGTVETDSHLLLDKVGALESQADLKKQLLTAVEIREHLSAISFKLHELEQNSRAEQSKDQDKQKLGEILRREEYQKPPEKQESVMQQLLRRFLEWLESIFPRPNVPAQSFSGMGFLVTLLQVLLYAVLLGLLGFIVYKIVPLIFPHLRRARSRQPKKKRMILGEQVGDDVTAGDLFDEAERLAREGDLRGAIRKGYIALLCDLSDRKVIGLARDKTNRDYVRDVRTRTDLHPRLKSVTDTFERHWYGFEESVDEDWARFRDEYKDAIRSV